jgi:M6 family metalloprotease-like protein
MRGFLGALAACTLGSFAMAGPAQADAGACNLSGPGREGPTDTTFFQVPDQTLEAAMIFVDFSNHVASGAETPPNTTIGPALANRATTYMNEVSYGNTQLQVDVGTAWLRMSQPSTSYALATFAGQRAYIAEAIQKADTAGFNFAGRQTVIVVAAPGAFGNSAAFHGAAADGISVDGTNVRWGTTIGDDGRLVDARWPQYGSKVLSHELGHTFGLPDLYRFSAFDFDTQHLDVGSWDIMGWPGPGLHLFGWHKQKLGWLGPSDMICVDGQATANISPLDDAGGIKMMVAKTAPGVAYVAEARRAVGMDSEMCDSGGVLIYRVNANGDNGSFPNGIAPITVKPVYPDEPGNPSGQCAALSNAGWELGPGEPDTFSEAGVTVEILSGSPMTGYSVRMSGPTPSPPPPPTSGGTTTAPTPSQNPRAIALAKCKKKKSAKARKKCRKKANKLPVTRERLIVPRV